MTINMGMNRVLDRNFDRVQPDQVNVKYLVSVIKATREELIEIFLNALRKDVITDLPTITRTKDLIDYLLKFEKMEQV